jgi:hypothetical protein
MFGSSGEFHHALAGIPTARESWPGPPKPQPFQQPYYVVFSMAGVGEGKNGVFIRPRISAHRPRLQLLTVPRYQHAGANLLHQFPNPISIAHMSYSPLCVSNHNLHERTQVPHGRRQQNCLRRVPSGGKRCWARHRCSEPVRGKSPCRRSSRPWTESNDARAAGSSRCPPSD